MSLYSQPWINITFDLPSIIQAFQDLRYLGELRQRWEEIKKLQDNIGKVHIQPAF